MLLMRARARARAPGGGGGREGGRRQEKERQREGEDKDTGKRRQCQGSRFRALGGGGRPVPLGLKYSFFLVFYCSCFVWVPGGASGGLLELLGASPESQNRNLIFCLAFPYCISFGSFGELLEQMGAKRGFKKSCVRSRIETLYFRNVMGPSGQVGFCLVARTPSKLVMSWPCQSKSLNPKP